MRISDRSSDACSSDLAVVAGRLGHGTGSGKSIIDIRPSLGAMSGVVPDPGYRTELDALVLQPLGFLRRRLAVDAVRVDLAIVDAARLRGEAVADIVAVLLDDAAQCPQLPLQLGDLSHRRMHGLHLGRSLDLWRRRLYRRSRFAALEIGKAHV